jgi:hypothetical protein
MDECVRLEEALQAEESRKAEQEQSPRRLPVRRSSGWPFSLKDFRKTDEIRLPPVSLELAAFSPGPPEASLADGEPTRHRLALPRGATTGTIRHKAPLGAPRDRPKQMLRDFLVVPKQYPEKSERSSIRGAQPRNTATETGRPYRNRQPFLGPPPSPILILYDVSKDCVVALAVRLCREREPTLKIIERRSTLLVPRMWHLLVIGPQVLGLSLGLCR